VAGGELLGELVAAGLAEALVLGGVDLGRLLQDLLGDLLVGADRGIGGIRPELGAVDGEHPDLDQPRLRAEAEHAAKESRQRLPVANPEAGDRGVVGDLVGGDHPEGDVLAAATLDPAR
jgi:hypothetical protein